jgi:TPR repeat protein
MAKRFASTFFLIFSLLTFVPEVVAQQTDKKKKEWAEQYVALRHDAELGNAWAQGQLGYAYWLDNDYENAFQWFQKAAAQGEASAQFRLGTMYEEGRATPQNYHGAMLWYRKAAEQGDWGAQTYLARMYRNGLGVMQDNVRAYLWQSVASAHGAGAPVRDEIASKMTTDQISRAQEAAELCYTSNYKNCY